MDLKYSNNGNKDVEKGCVAIESEGVFKSLSLSRYNMYLNKKKLKKNQFNMKKNRKYKITISKIKDRGLLFFKVGKKGYWSNDLGIATGVPELSVKRKGNTLVLKWSKIKNSKGYVIYRGSNLYATSSKKKPYKIIKSGNALTFVDRKVKKGRVYYYSVRAIKAKVRSKVKYGAIVNVAKNLKYARKSSLFKKVTINNNKKWNANAFSLPNGVYPPIKYRFTGKELEIHIYIDIVKYVKMELIKADPSTW